MRPLVHCVEILAAYERQVRHDRSRPFKLHRHLPAPTRFDERNGLSWLQIENIASEHAQHLADGLPMRER